jgi:hypothetical protein
MISEIKWVTSVFYRNDQNPFDSTVLCHVKYGNKESAQNCCKNHSRIVLYNTVSVVSVVSDSEVFFIFLKVDVDGTARNISERHKVWGGGLENV